ncbi:MAG: hypothetical protein RLZZ127_1285 [Planctomycetota bacterium]|jgi:two-component system catabolic regulation response regulator CreB
MPTLLIVEDDPAIADAVALALGREGWTCRQARTLAGARAACADRPLLVVLDLGLPDGSGLDLCRELRQDQVPVLVLSARREDLDRILALELGADDYLTKPFHPRELVARIRAILRRCAGPAAPPRMLELDPRQCRAVWCGTLLDLPRLPRRILEILAAQPGRVFSRSDLLDLAWDHPDEATDRAVDSQVRHLRAVLAAVRPDLEPVRTVRGEGYAWDPACA